MHCSHAAHCTAAHNNPGWGPCKGCLVRPVDISVWCQCSVFSPFHSVGARLHSTKHDIVHLHSDPAVLGMGQCQLISPRWVLKSVPTMTAGRHFWQGFAAGFTSCRDGDLSQDPAAAGAALCRRRRDQQPLGTSLELCLEICIQPLSGQRSTPHLQLHGMHCSGVWPCLPYEAKPDA